MRKNFQTAADIADRLRAADASELAALERALAADTRKTVADALQAAKNRIAREEAERRRVESLYAFERELSGGALLMGLDEVGRGPLAGPLAVAAVVLGEGEPIAGLNDSKQVDPSRREAIAAEVKSTARAWTVVMVEAAEIDARGMAACLRSAFAQAIRAIDEQLAAVQTVLIDGNPLRIDKRELNVVKGDAQCASIAAASILAKTARDALMVDYDRLYPAYGFASNKGYASSAHQEAIRTQGLSPIHRKSFCSAFLQESLF